MSWLLGLGQGLQQFGQMIPQAAALRQQAQQQAIENALRQQQVELQAQAQARQNEVAERQLREMEFENAFKVTSNLPGGTVLTPEHAARNTELGLGGFQKTQVAPGFMGLPTLPMGVPGEEPKHITQTVSVPTEDTKTRTAALNREAAMQRMQFAYQQRAAMQAEKLRIQNEWHKATDQNQKSALGLRLQELHLREAALDRQIANDQDNSLYRWTVELPNTVFDNEVAKANAERPRGGGAPALDLRTGQPIPGTGTPVTPGARVAATPAVGPVAGKTTKVDAKGNTYLWNGTGWDLHIPAPSRGNQSRRPSK